MALTEHPVLATHRNQHNRQTYVTRKPNPNLTKECNYNNKHFLRSLRNRKTARRPDRQSIGDAATQIVTIAPAETRLDILTIIAGQSIAGKPPLR